MTRKPQQDTAAQIEDAAIQLEHEFVEIIRQHIGLHEAMATAHAQALVRGLRERLGGQEVWIPAPDKSERNAAICREFNGRNIKQLMTQHRISRSQLYHIVGAAQPKGKGRPGSPSIGGSSPAAPKSPVSPLQTGQGPD